MVINLDRHVSRNETLAEYYVRTYRHLLDDVSVMEFDQKQDCLIVLGGLANGSANNL